jgi:hypothetical protein
LAAGVITALTPCTEDGRLVAAETGTDDVGADVAVALEEAAEAA